MSIFGEDLWFKFYDTVEEQLREAMKVRWPGRARWLALYVKEPTATLNGTTILGLHSGTILIGANSKAALDQQISDAGRHYGAGRAYIVRGHKPKKTA